jgi:ATP-dependent Clp protease ATP-binding subunit ClpC
LGKRKSALYSMLDLVENFWKHMNPQPNFPDKEIRKRCAWMLSPAAEEARKQGHNYIGVEHCFMAMTRLEDGPTANLLKRAGLSASQMRRELRKEIGTGEGAMDDTLPLTPRLGLVLSIAIALSERDDDNDIDEAHVLLAIMEEGESVPVRKMIELGFDVNLWLKRLIAEAYHDDFQVQDASMIESQIRKFAEIDDDFPSDEIFFDSEEVELRKSNGRMPTPLLDKYGRDLTQQAEEGKINAAIAREREIKQVARTLLRSKKNNPLLLGDAGVGKTAVVEGLAYAIQMRTAPESLLNRRIVQIEIGTLVAGTSLRGQFEERLIGIVDEAKAAGDVILFIDEIHTIVGAGDTIDSNLDAANILKPALARGEITCIGATTHEEYRRAIAQDPALARRFRPIDIGEPTRDDALAVLQGQRNKLESHHGVHITAAAMEAAVDMSIRYMSDRRLPDKALDLLDEACARVLIQTVPPDDDRSAISEVRVENIAAVLSDWTGIPVSELTADEKRRLSDLENFLLQRVIGQETAVKTVAETVKMGRAGLHDPKRPLGVFLFLGPSGVGKTELARALANFLFGSDDAMIRLDMSEFHDEHTVARLIGAPPGYKDANRGGQLTDALRRRPYCVVLLDEIEKAAPQVYDIFLQVFDEGRLSDAQGAMVDARHAVFIMTSNIGTEEVGKALGFITAGREPDYSSYLNRYFRPEFLNRVDEVIKFRPLDTATLSKILDLQLAELYTRLGAQKLSLRLTDEARALILKRGHDPVNGARPLRRAIERMLTRPLSTQIVEDTFPPGTTIRVAAEGETLTFAAEATETA